MKKVAGFLALLAVLTLIPGAVHTDASMMLNDAQMAQISGSGEGCDLVGGIGIGLGIGGVFGCGPCIGASAIILAAHWAFC